MQGRRNMIAYWMEGTEWPSVKKQTAEVNAIHTFNGELDTDGEKGKGLIAATDPHTAISLQRYYGVEFNSKLWLVECDNVLQSRQYDHFRHQKETVISCRERVLLKRIDVAEMLRKFTINIANDAIEELKRIRKPEQLRWYGEWSIPNEVAEYLKTADKNLMYKCSKALQAEFREREGHAYGWFKIIMALLDFVSDEPAHMSLAMFIGLSENGYDENYQYGIDKVKNPKIISELKELIDEEFNR